MFDSIKAWFTDSPNKDFLKDAEAKLASYQIKEPNEASLEDFEDDYSEVLDQLAQFKHDARPRRFESADKPYLQAYVQTFHNKIQGLQAEATSHVERLNQAIECCGELAELSNELDQTHRYDKYEDVDFVNPATDSIEQYVGEMKTLLEDTAQYSQALLESLNTFKEAAEQKVTVQAIHKVYNIEGLEEAMNGVEEAQEDVRKCLESLSSKLPDLVMSSIRVERKLMMVEEAVRFCEKLKAQARDYSVPDLQDVVNNLPEMLLNSPTIREENRLEALQKKMTQIFDAVPIDAQPPDIRVDIPAVLPEKDTVRDDYVRHFVVEELADELAEKAYEANDQDALRKTFHLSDSLGLGAKLKSKDWNGSHTLQHSVSNRPFAEHGSWEGRTNDPFLSPEEYARRILKIVQNGLRSSEREDSQLRGDARSFKEVWFHMFGSRKDSDYGPVKIVWDVPKNYCVFRGRKDDGMGNTEYFVLLNPEKKLPFDQQTMYVRLSKNWLDGQDLTVYDKERNSEHNMLAKTYVNKVHQYLQRDCPNYDVHE